MDTVEKLWLDVDRRRIRQDAETDHPHALGLDHLAVAPIAAPPHATHSAPRDASRSKNG
jgi:hypothetical protein